AYLGLGNLAYRGADLDRAIGFYRRGLEANPHDPALLNNLASILGEAGCPRMAERLLQAFAATPGAGSKWQADIEVTLAELAARAGGDDPSCGAYGI
ncbi:MAG: tetratricopeptide repeat protein, partial [Pseudomonadales bacterium]